VIALVALTGGLWAATAAALNWLLPRRGPRPQRAPYCASCSGPMPGRGDLLWYCSDSCRESLARVAIRRLRPDLMDADLGIEPTGLERDDKTPLVLRDENALRGAYRQAALR
jgi:hypothetical protein